MDVFRGRWTAAAVCKNLLYSVYKIIAKNAAYKLDIDKICRSIKPLL